MKLHSIIMGLLSFFASIFILYSIGNVLSIEWLQYNTERSFLSAGFWLPLILALLIGILIVRKYKSRLG
jgi:Ni/Fe-hydrogenase subunit HybB-like protein